VSNPRPKAVSARVSASASAPPDAVAVAGVVLVCLAALLAGVLEVMLVPLRSGTVLVPVSVLGALVGNVAFPRMGRALAPRTAAMTAPFVAWLAPIVVAVLVVRPEGDVLIPGGGGEQWVFYATLLCGGVAGMATIVSAAPPRPAPLQSRRR
jgi:hypothetical protein